MSRLAPRLADKLIHLPPNELASVLTPLSAPQLASLISIILAHHPDYYAVFPENLQVVSYHISKLASMVADGPFLQLIRELASKLASQFSPEVTHKLASREVWALASRLASALSYQEVYESTQAAPSPTPQPPALH
jgi:hypothetical protein